MTAWPPTRISSPLSKTGSISAWAATRKKLRRDTSALTILLSLYETWRKRFGGERPKADSRASVFGIKRFSFNMVGAGRFERPTPCAQGGVRHGWEVACFQVLTFQGVGAGLLKSVEAC